jgi:hypothetical protein
MPKVTVEKWFACCSTRDQNVRSRSRRSPGWFPAIRAALMAPF